MRKRSDPKIKPWGTPARNDFHDKVCPFKVPIWNLPDK